MAKQRPKPRSIQVPNGRGGYEWYDLAVFSINTKTENGTPRLCTMFPHDRHEIELAGGEEFMTGYIPRQMYKDEPDVEER